MRSEPVTVEELAIPVHVLAQQVRSAGEAVSGQNYAVAPDPALRFEDAEVARLYEEDVIEHGDVRLSWDLEWPTIDRALLVGAPGGGKTFLSRWTALRLVEKGLERLEAGGALEDVPIPVLVDLTELAEHQRGLRGANGLAGYLVDWLEEQPAVRETNGETLPRQGQQAFGRWLEPQLRTGQTWLILDALDQVPRDKLPEVWRWLELFNAWNAHQLLTCRSADYDEFRDALATVWKRRRIAAYELAPFSPSDVRRFVQRWFRADPRSGELLLGTLQRSFGLSHACRTPIITTMACLVHEEREDMAGARRKDLYGDALRLLLRRGATRQKKTLDGDTLEQRIEIVGHTAWLLFESRSSSNQFSQAAVRNALTGAVRGLRSDSGDRVSADALHKELIAAGILVRAGSTLHEEVRWSFLHRSFLEYLAAHYLVMRAGNRGWSQVTRHVKSHLETASWQGLLVFLAAELEDPVPMLQAVARSPRRLLRRRDTYRAAERLALAIRCAGDLAPATGKVQMELDRLTEVVVGPRLGHRTALRANRMLPTPLERVLAILAQAGGRVDGAPLLDILDASVRRGTPEDRRTALTLLEHIGEMAASHEDIVPVLLDQLRAPNRVPIEWIVSALGSFGEEGIRRHPALAPALFRAYHRPFKDGFSGARDALRVVLPKLGDAIAEWSPSLIVMLVDQACAGAIRAPDVARAEEQAVAKTMSESERALESLGLVGSGVANCPTAIARLAQLLVPDAAVTFQATLRTSVTRTLRMIGPCAAMCEPRVVALLVGCLEESIDARREPWFWPHSDSIRSLKSGAIQALEAMGELAVQDAHAVPAIARELLSSGESMLQYQAAESLQKLAWLLAARLYEAGVGSFGNVV